ncbi:MAG TPA: GIY-YIG nuclease family protein [Candidatus Paceibacterota bacterium]|nr:GIY-YIG nuclease family protein [Candidatus Paceibacterota bacterium]
MSPIATKIPYKKFPETPGVYIMKDADGRVLYVGKAGNLRRRVSSYFERPHDVRIQTLVGKIAAIDTEQKDTALEALIREAELIKTLTPPFNVREKDDKSFLYFEITREKFPRVLLVRGAGVIAAGGKDGGVVAERGRYGPFTSASNAREALRILRRIFPWSTHDPDEIGRLKRPCFNYEIGLCPGTCVGAITHDDYLKTIDRLQMFFEGKKERIIRALEKDMKAAAKEQEFEKAEALRRQMFALRHIQDTALISDSDALVAPAAGAGALRARYRIEGYDISNISGTSAVGSMVVFTDGTPDKEQYRKFKIRSIFQPNDVGMLKEVLERRFAHSAPADSEASRAAGKESARWRMPDLVLIDGGLAQVNTARRVLLRAGMKIPVVGIAKGPRRDRNDVIGLIPKGVQKATLIKVRDEAHRFAISYHKTLRGIRTLQ